MAGDKTKFRLGAANLYIKEGSPLAFVHAGFVTALQVTLGTTRATLTGGQTGTSTVDKVVTGGNAMFDGEFEQITLESYMRAGVGNALLTIDDTTSTKRMLEWVANAGQSMLALAQYVKIVPIVGGAETTNLEEIINAPLAIAEATGIVVKYDWQNKATIKFQFDCLVDDATRDRMLFWGDSTATSTSRKKVL